MQDHTSRAMASRSTKTQASLYHNNSSIPKNAGQKLLSKIKVQSPVLDLGCGTGYLASVMSEMVGSEGKVVAVDPDAERIRIATEKNAQPNITYLIGDDQSFPGDEYSLITANYVIHWIQNKEALFTHIYNKLAAGGQFAFTTPDGTPEFPPTMRRVLCELVDPEFVDTLFKRKCSFQNYAFYQNLAEAVGLKIVFAKVETSYDQWPSLVSFLNFWAGVSHGDIDVDSINQEKLLKYKESHENELVQEKMQHNTLYMILIKM